MLRTLKQRFLDARTLKSLCFGAEDHANRRGQREPGAEHLILSALDLPEGSARRVFGKLGVDPEGFAQAIEAQYHSALAGTGIEVDAAVATAGISVAPGRGPYRAQASFQNLMQVLTREIMVTEQRRDRRVPLTGAHVLLAAASARHGVSVRAFDVLGIDGEALARAARDVMAGTSPAGSPAP